MIPIRTRPYNFTPRALLSKRLGDIEILLTNGYWEPITLKSLMEEKADLERRLLEPLNTERRPIGGAVSADVCSHIIKENHMFVEFETKLSELSFNNVQQGQMFVDGDGSLCQRSSEHEDTAWCIANSEGCPIGEQFWYKHDEIIKKILPPIKKISF